ncbi:RICIN domain-containing protein [Bifidobacterium saguini]|nr:RICIN domain-containing protein [Bifidobacterium saguini]QTB90054.1 RICIN domain-containing protein [Bifidobacterium saguini]
MIDDSTAADAMPDNPDAALPDKVSAGIPDDATVVSENHAVTANGELKDIETGETVTDPNLVGTEDKQPDPLAKTDGESFIPVQADEVKQKVEEVKGAAAVGGETADDQSSADSSDDSTETDADDAAGTAGTVSDKRDAKSGKSAKASVKLASLQNNDYGAHWGTYNDTQAFFDANNNLFVQQAKGVIDVSTYQGTIDWQAAKNAGVEGAIIRISYGWDNGFDTQALRNISECKRLGIPFGIYSYSYAYDSATAANEGNDIVKLLKQAGVNPGDLSYPVFYDLERWSWTGHTPPTDPNVYDGIVNTWYSKLKTAGYNNLGVYSYTSYLNSSLNKASIHAKTRWVAQYGSTMGFTSWPTNDRGWQYTSGGSIAGISGRVDLNAFGYKEYQAETDVRYLGTITIPDGTYYINSVKKNSSSIEIAGGSSATGAITQLYGYNKSQAQRFVFSRQSDGSYVIKNAASGKVLDVAGGDAKLNAVVQQYEANGSNAQKWFIRDSGSGWYVQSALGNWVLDIAGGNTANGTTIALYGPNDSVAQKFSLSSVDANVATNTSVRVQSAKNSSYVMDIESGSTANSAKAQLYNWNDTDAQLYALTEVGNGVYEIQNRRSGKVLEVAGAGAGNGVAIQQYAQNGTAAQHWSVISKDGELTFLSAATAKVIDIPSGNAVASVKLQTYAYNGTAAQQWNLDKQLTLRERLDALASEHKSDLPNGTYKVMSSAKASMVLDVVAGSAANGANVQLYSSNDTDAQRWIITHDGKGYVTLTNAASGKVLDVAAGSTANGANIQQYASNGSWAQKWIAVKNADGSITLRSAAVENRVVDVAAGSTANGANVQLYSGNGSAAQKWNFGKATTARERLNASASKNKSVLENGTYVFASKARKTAVLDVAAGSTANGANVQLYSSNDTNAQRWKVTHDGNDYVILTNVGSGKVLDVTAGSAANGANVQQYASNGSWAQKWIAVENADGSITLHSAMKENLVIDVAAGSTANGANVQIYASNGTQAQKWIPNRK